jgi:hypothetical protein
MRSSVMAKPGSWYKCCPLDLVLNNHMQIMTMTNPHLKHAFDKKTNHLWTDVCRFTMTVILLLGLLWCPRLIVELRTQLFLEIDWLLVGTWTSPLFSKMVVDLFNTPPPTACLVTVPAAKLGMLILRIDCRVFSWTCPAPGNQTNSSFSKRWHWTTSCCLRKPWIKSTVTRVQREGKALVRVKGFMTLFECRPH